MPRYARYGVEHACIVEPKVGRLEAFELVDDTWRGDIGAFESDAPIRIAPFDAIEIEPPCKA